MSPALMETVACHWCGKFRPRWRTHTLVSHQTICDYCVEWHYKALDFLAGAPPAGCQQCGKTAEQMGDQTPGAVLRVFVVPKDGVLQMLCQVCVAPYLPTQKQLYKGTRFGAETLKVL